MHGMCTRLPLLVLVLGGLAACSGSNTPVATNPPPQPCEVTGCTSGSYCDTVSHTCRNGCGTSVDCSIASQTCGADHVCRCPVDTHVCGTSCVSSLDVATCATRCTPCAEPSANGHAVCGGWLTIACGIQCDDPTAKVCGTDCVSCPGASSFDCGTTPGTCVARSCLPGYHRAGDACLPWVIEEVALDSIELPILSDTWSAIAIDPAGVPEVVWASYGVYHERRGEAGWTRTPLAAAGWRPLLAIDGSGTSHALYTGQVTVDTSYRHDLVYTRREVGAGFSSETIAQGITGVNQLGPLAYALALDASGVPHVAYWDDTAGKLRHGVRGVGGGWSLEDVASTAAGAIGLAVDAMGRVHLAFRDNAAKSLVYTVKEPGGWSAAETVDLAGGAGAYADIEPAVALAADAGGHPRIVYVEAPYSQYGRSVWLAERPAASWTFKPVNAGGSLDMDEQVSIAIDSHGGTHLALETSGDVLYLAPEGAYWSVFKAVDGINGAGRVGFALDAQNRPHLAWCQYLTKQAIWYAR